MVFAMHAFRSNPHGTCVHDVKPNDTCQQVRSSLLAAVSAVEEHARSNGVSILLEDAGAGLRKTVPPGDEVRQS